MVPEKAYLALIQPSPGGSEIARVTFPYNPKEFSYKKTAQWERKPARGAKSSAPPEFKGADPESLTVEVFLDGYEKNRDVSGTIDTLLSCCVPQSDSLTNNKPSPPWVLFGWGDKVHLRALVKSVDVKCTMFSPEGLPLRAVCNVSMEEIADELPFQNPTSGGLKPLRSHLVVTGDSLPSIAYREYGKADWWRPIAQANGIDDPLRLRVGTRILVPDIDDALTQAEMGMS